ncbi:MAG: BrnT family toxin [Elusimicrobiota bacterium]
MLQFDWDLHKVKSNIKKHGVNFNEAATVFSDPLSASFPDPDHSLLESRYILIGMSEENKLLVVSYVEYSGIIRIISSRKATKFERRYYEEEK